MNRIDRSNRRLPAATALILLAASIGLMGCDGKTDEQQAGGGRRVPSVGVEVVRQGPISRLLELTGEVAAAESVVISATVDGPIGYCPWREGDRIERAGQKLIEIDRALYRAEVNAAEASVEVAKAKLADLQAGTRPEEIAKAQESVRQLEEAATFAKADYDRTAQLAESGSLPAEAMEKARVAYMTEQAKLAAARSHLEMLQAGHTRTAIAMQEAAVKEASAKLDLAQARLAECVISAPFAGTITRVHVRRGDLAMAKAPLLEMADLSSLVIRAAVPEAHASAVHEGMAARVSLDSFGPKTFKAKVVRIYPELDRRMRTRTIEMVLSEAVGLSPGMFARIRLVLESAEDAVTVAEQAVVLTPNGEGVVYVVVEGKAVQRKVEIGIDQAGRVQVLAGLEPGEKAIVAGQETLRDGMEVRVPGPGRTPSESVPGAGGVDGAKGGNR